MAVNQTSDEVFEEHKRVLGEEFGTHFNALHNDLIYLFIKWKEFKQLFSSSKYRIDLLNKAAGFFFYTTQQTLIENIILNLARLIDPKESVGKKNLTVNWFPTFISDAIHKKEIEALITNAKDLTIFARDWRNRRLAHKDLVLVMNPKIKPLEEATIINIDESLNSIESIMQWIHRNYFDSQFLYNGSSIVGGAELLLIHLQDGVKAREDRFERMRNGTASDEDLKHNSVP